MAELIATQFDTVAEAAVGCDGLLASGLAHFASRSVAEKLGIHYVYATFCTYLLPSPDHAPPPVYVGLAMINDGDDCFVVGELNQQELFGRVAAVVHHGGAGTTTTAARAGAPQVVVPQAGDQPDWAARVADLGIGAAHEGPTPTTASLSAALRTALTPDTGARATALAGTIRTDGAAAAATLLVDTLSRERPPESANLGSELMA